MGTEIGVSGVELVKTASSSFSPKYWPCTRATSRDARRRACSRAVHAKHHARIPAVAIECDRCKLAGPVS